MDFLQRPRSRTGVASAFTLAFGLRGDVTLQSGKVSHI